MASLGRSPCAPNRLTRLHEHFASATTMYRDMSMTYWLEKAEAEARDLA